MKTLKRFAFIVAAFILMAFQCSKDEQLAISVEVYPTSIAADGVAQARFSVFEGNADVTSDAVIYNVETGEALKGNTFSTTVPGTYYFYAEYNGQKSDHVSVVAEQVIESAFVKKICLMEFTDAQCTFCPAASRYIDQFILARNENVHLMAFHEKDQWALPQYAALQNMFKITATPYAVVDMRQGFSMENGKMGDVKEAVGNAPEVSPAHCGVAVSSINNGQSAKVTAEVYSEKSANYYLALYVVEDGIIGAQLDNGLQTQDYYHQYVVRQMLSVTVYGDNLGRVNARSEASREYDVVIDPTWNLTKTYVYALAMDENGYVNNMQVCLLDGGSAGYEYKKKQIEL